MKYGLTADSEDEDLLSVDFSISSDENDSPSDTKPKPPPTSKLSRSIQACLASSESEPGSEDEVEAEWAVVRQKEAPAWREAKSGRRKSVTLKSASGLKASLNKPPWTAVEPPKSRQSRSSGRRNVKEEPDLDDLLQEKPSELEEWMKANEESAMVSLILRGMQHAHQEQREGFQIAHDRQVKIREINKNARNEFAQGAQNKTAKAADEMRRLLEGLTIQQMEEQKVTARDFEQRAKKLWDDIDAAIAEVEIREAAVRQKEADLHAQVTRKAKMEEDARALAAEKGRVAKRAEEEKTARELAEKEAAQTLVRQQADRESAALNAQQAQQKEIALIAKEKSELAEEWSVWTAKQQWMKKEVIDIVKGNRQIRTGMRTSMRLITRGLGQVVNTREGILRVTNDMHHILVEQLPMSPSASNPTLFDHPPPLAYSYLLSHLAKTMVKQAEAEVSAKADAAFPLAKIVIGLLLRGHAAVADVLFARFVKKCPWVIPFWPTRQADQSREEYERSTGRKSDESVADYILRMSGIAAIYFAVVQTALQPIISTLPTPPTPDQLLQLIPPVFRFPAGWSWIAHSLRHPLPGFPPMATLIRLWFEIVGPPAMDTYGLQQMSKIVEAIMREGIEGKKIKSDSESTRQGLKMLLDDWRNLQPLTGKEWTT